ncbi:Hypothetical predicted protein [Mytilus galloprovincialis]|uniref:Uncharacterized protein n=1 Tax=Mytilus galloprovincialis TaxID=29158 RepID=A0A8B6BHD4_MYTGA|nr:Hypothetical predicted protein [Mytilus galloprovincialis]
MDSAENKFETPRLTAQGRPVLPDLGPVKTFHDLTPTGEISIRVNQDQWPSQENTDRYEKDVYIILTKRPLSGAEGYAEAEGTAEAKGSAEGDSGNTRRGATSCESRWDSGDLPRTLDRGVLHNMGATYQALPLTSRDDSELGLTGPTMNTVLMK